MKRKVIVAVMAVLLSLLTNNAAFAARSGKCGDNITWTLDNNGTLVLTGRGEMYDYDEESALWYADYSIIMVRIGEGITSIGDYAFGGCSSLKSVEIPNSVTSIGNNAFELCSGLEEVNITDLAAWCKIKFGNDYSNPLVGAHLYLNGEEVTKLTIPNSVTSIGDYAFGGCDGLKSVEIGNSVANIGNHAFGGCSGLRSMEMPNSVASIGNYAFGDCSGLASVEIPNSVTSIGASAFSGCRGLASVEIGNSVDTIGYGAFINCSGLESVEVLAKDPPKCGNRVFDGVKGCVLLVPATSFKAYKKADPWRCFGDNITVGVEGVDSDKEGVAVTAHDDEITISGVAVK